jgi:hypothetical protein
MDPSGLMVATLALLSKDVNMEPKSPPISISPPFSISNLGGVAVLVVDSVRPRDLPP